MLHIDERNKQARKNHLHPRKNRKTIEHTHDDSDPRPVSGVCDFLAHNTFGSVSGSGAYAHNRWHDAFTVKSSEMVINRRQAKHTSRQAAVG